MKISIPEPCNEDWNAMTPVDFQRRHCAACDRTLTDFTAMTDAEIGRHLRNASGQLCGRFSSQQLDRRLALTGPRNYGGARAVAAAAGLLLATPVVGQGVQSPQTELSSSLHSQLPENPVDGSGKSDSLADTITITGVVRDETGESLIGVSVLLKGTTTGTVTDIDGRFSLDVSTTNPVNLMISYTGYMNKDIAVDVTSLEAVASTTFALEVSLLVSSHDFVAGIIIHHRSLAHRVFITPVNRYLVWPVKRAVRGIGDWRRGRFDRREARQLRRAERQAARIHNEKDPELPSSAPAPIGHQPKDVTPVTLGFKASPNPFNDHLRVTFSLEERGAYHLELYDVSGKQLGYWEGVGEAGPQEHVLDQELSDLPAGMFFLELTTKTKASVLTLVR